MTDHRKQYTITSLEIEKKVTHLKFLGLVTQFQWRQTTTVDIRPSASLLKTGQGA